MDLSVLKDLFSLDALFLLVIGTAFGIVIGAIPGLGSGIGVSVLLPFTFAMNPLSGLLLLAGVFMGGAYGGAISGVLLNIPGTSEALCTTIEGYPMAKKGRGKEALYLAGISSTVGGLFGVLVLILLTPVLARAALKFGPPEMALVSLIGLTIVGSLSANKFLKGYFGAVFGMFLSMVGVDTVSGVTRFTFGVDALILGFKLVAVAGLGIVASREMMLAIKKAALNGRKARDGTAEKKEEIKLEKTSALQVAKNVFTKHKKTLIKSSVLGTFIGILPGAGAAISAFLAYGEARRKAKEPFGDGNPEGIVAAESANNAAVGGSFVPMLALGIPGSPTCALIFGALTLHGITAGPRLFTDHANITYGFMFGLLLSVIIMGIIAVFGVPLFAKILAIKMEYIIPAVVGCIILGAFSLRNNMYDVFCAVVFGLIGILFNKIQIPQAPVFLGIILGPIIEKNIVTASVIAGAEGVSIFVYTLTRPLSIAIFLLGVLLMYTNIKSVRRESEMKKEMKSS